MQIKNIAQFRRWFKELRPSRNTDLNNENFMGSFHGDFTGFFGMYQGEKTDIYGFLRKEIEMAEDGQAVFEFLQNAADSGATDFYMFFDEKNFLVINNGEPFEINGVKSILNVGQSFGKEDCGKIGRFGIGFKLVHRLVGKTSGLDELIKEYAGPQMFSWYKADQVNNFIDESINELETGPLEGELPWLLKILITNFPAHPGETVKDLNFNDRIPYDWEEVKSFKSFFNKVKGNITLENLNSGTAFYLRLGQGKIDLLNKEEESLLDGIENSMNFLKSIRKVVVNGRNLKKSSELRLEPPFVLLPDSEEFKGIGLTEERDLACPAILQFGYADYKIGLNLIKNKPNFYKYFPMGEETNGLNFILHSNVFGIESNRRKIHDSTVNRSILKIFSVKIIELMEGYKTTSPDKYRSIFSNLIMSDKPSSEGRNKWQAEFFYDELLRYCRGNVPTKEGNYLSYDKVVVSNIKLDLNPTVFGVEAEWYYWDSRDDFDLITESTHVDKLDLDRWDLVKLVKNSNVNKVNDWIRNAGENEIEFFITEINKNIPEEIFFDIEFLKGSDGDFYSINKIYELNNVIITFEKLIKIGDVLRKIGLITTEINISKYETIQISASKKIDYLKDINERFAFEKFIKPFTQENLLEVNNKKELLLAVKELHNVGPKALKEWEIFTNRDGDIKPLGELVTFKIKLEPWLTKYQINDKEYFKELDDYLIQQEEVYPEIIYNKWNEIIDEYDFDESIIRNLYNSVVKYYNEDIHKGKDLTKYRYIFCESKFLGARDVFYHESFLGFSEYLVLASAIKKVTDYETPSFAVVEFLSKAPFQTSNDILLNHINEVEIETDEAYELLRYCQKTETKLFANVRLIENDCQITISADRNYVQYYSSDDDLIEFIEEHLEETFVLLPSHLEDFRTLEGIFRNQDLYEKIISKLDSINEMAEEFLPLLKHKEIIKSYISNLEEIRINSGNELLKDCYEYKIISYIIQFFEEEEYQEIKDKFIIESNEIEFKLSEINSSNEIHFDLDDRLYSLKVSEILPDSDSFTKIEILDTLKAKFRKLELPKSGLEKLFGVEIEEDDLIEKIANDFTVVINDKTLENAEQLAFALLYEATKGWKRFGDFKIWASNEDTYSLNEIWYVRNYSFLNETASSSVRYERIAKILRLKEDQPIFKVNDDCIFLWKPTFDEEGVFLCQYIEEGLNSDKCVDLFDFLFEEYNKRGKDSKRDFEAIKDWGKLGDTETEKIIGFVPNEIILSEDSDYLVESEQAPDWLVTWCDSKEKSQFLTILGINQDDSDIFKLRRSLLGEIEISSEELSNSFSLNARLLENTLDWLCIGEIWEGKWVDDPEKVELLNCIISELNKSVEDYWFIHTDKLNEDSEEWDDLNYENWRGEVESFEVRLINGNIPYKLVYNDLILAEHFKGDFWHDENAGIFYCNAQKSTLLLLQLAAEEGIINSDSIKALTNQGLARVKELEEENNRLRNQVANSRSHGGSEEGIPTSDLLDNTDEKTRIAINEEAQQQIFATLRSKGYKIPSDIKISYTIVEGIINPSGTDIKVVAKSAKGGTIYFNPSEWLALSEDDSQLFVVLSGNKVFNVTIDDLINNNDKFHLRFNTEAFAVKANLKAFAQMVKYLPETHFLFKAPISTSDFFKEFGLNERNPSSSDLSADDINLLH